MSEAKALEMLLETLREVIHKVRDKALRIELIANEKKYKRWYTRASEKWEKNPLSERVRGSKVYEIGLKAVRKWSPGTVFTSSQARDFGAGLWYHELYADGLLERRRKIVGKGYQYRFIEDAPKLLEKLVKLQARGRRFYTP